MKASTSYWYNKAAITIQTALNEAKEKGLDDKETWKLVDARYPFGPREHWPYKQWLKARKKAKEGQRWQIVEPPLKERPKVCWWPSCSEAEGLAPFGERWACRRHAE